MLILVSAILLLSISAYIFFQTAPQIGRSAEGERLKRMQSSPNYEDAKFKNIMATNMDMPLSALRKVLAHYLFADKTQKEPQEVVQTKPFDPTHEPGRR